MRPTLSLTYRPTCCFCLLEAGTPKQPWKSTRRKSWASYILVRRHFSARHIFELILCTILISSEALDWLESQRKVDFPQTQCDCPKPINAFLLLSLSLYFTALPLEWLAPTQRCSRAERTGFCIFLCTPFCVHVHVSRLPETRCDCL